MFKYIFYALPLSLVLSGCGSGALFQNSNIVKSREASLTKHPPKVYKNVRFEYKIALHDRIVISVYNHPELSTRTNAGILVNAAGNVHLPLIGSVHLGGLTQPNAALKIQSLYGKYLKRSSVHLEVVNKKAYVIGEVKSPGIVALPNEQTTLLGAIASARGFSDTADKKRIVIMRKSGRGTRVEIVNLTNATSLSYANMMIKPNDIVYIAPSKLKNLGVNIMPLFRLASDALLPFIRYQDLTN